MLVQRKRSSKFFRQIFLFTVILVLSPTMLQAQNAIGDGAVANGSGSVSFGTNTIAHDTDTVALGTETNALGQFSPAVGSQARAERDRATALGQDAQAIASDSVAIGQGSIAAFTDSTAIGSGAQTTINDQVMIGDDDDIVTFGRRHYQADTGSVSYLVVDDEGNISMASDANVTITIDAPNSAQFDALETQMNEMQTFRSSTETSLAGHETLIAANTAAMALANQSIADNQAAITANSSAIAENSDDIERNKGGVALAMALSGGGAIPGKSRGSAWVGVGQFDGNFAAAASVNMRITKNIAVSAGYGAGSSAHGGKAALGFTW